MIATAIIAAALAPPLLFLLEMCWLAVSNPSTFWMVVTLYLQAPYG